MLISVDGARKAPGQVFCFAFEATDLGPLVLGSESIVMTKPVSIAGSITADTEGILVRGELHTAMQSVCARCLKPLTESVDATFDVRFHKSSDDDEVYLYEGDSLDITDMIKDHVLLAVPMQSFCSSKCKGLCQICGANLNEGDCAHVGTFE